MTDFNSSPLANPMPLQDAATRVHNFDEVALGYTPVLAADEARRCLQCTDPACMQGCPVHVDIPHFIARLRTGDLTGAAAIIGQTSTLPAICGRVCPQEVQCEARCVRTRKGQAVAIGRLERYVADHAPQDKPNLPQPNGKSVAIIGSGPSGLACAGDLAQLGYRVTVLEALHRLGGVLVYGIPPFRLPRNVLQDSIDRLQAMGVTFVTDVVVGKTVTLDDLFAQGSAAVYIATGAGLPNFMGIPGEALNGVYSANEFLTRCNLMQAYREDSDTPLHRGKTVAVVGGGNVAMDAARTALRLGADKVYIVYRRSMVELPARQEEVEHAQQEGIEFKLLCNPVRVVGYDDAADHATYGYVRALECVRMELGQPDERGRRRPVPIADSEFELPVDTVIMAIGTSPNPLLKRATPALATSTKGGIVTNAEGATSIPGVFAGGDAVTGAATVISAMGAGKAAAAAIDRYLHSQ